MIDKKEKEYQEFGEFVHRFIRDLNQMHEDGWSVLVEGQRDVRALRRLGYTGSLVSSSTLSRRSQGGLPSRRMIILTDLDREGAVLASRYVKMLRHEGFKSSLAERRRLKLASKGVFLHIENLSRFSEPGL